MKQNKIMLTALMAKMEATLKYDLVVLEYAIADINRYPYIGKSVSLLSSAISRTKSMLSECDTIEGAGGER